MEDTDPGSEAVESSADGSDRSEGPTETCACCSGDEAGFGDDGGGNTGDVEAGDGEDAFEYYAVKVRLESESSLIEADEGSSVLDAELPGELQDAARRFLGDVSVETLGDWAGEVRRRTGGGSIAVEDLCREREATGHWGDLDGERYHFRCFFDAVVLAALTDRRVELRTVSPGGTVIEATATGDGELSVSPAGTLASFGIATTAGATPDGDPTREDVYEAVCPVVQAFPTPQAYERWADTVPAATVAMPLADATELAAALAE